MVLMNVILIVSDTFRWDNLGCYGKSWVQTPNLDAFAEEAVVFGHTYATSFPTIPNRHDIFTGKCTFTYAEWAPLPRNENILPQILRQAGYVTQLILDTPHMLANGSNFDRGFDGWQWIRGQENDRYMTSPREVKIPCDPRKLRDGVRVVTQYLRNVSQRRFESDYFVAQTMTAAARWLELNYNRHEKFFLHVDTFDPHEPWDPPRWYVDMYDPDYEGEEVIYPVYGPCDYLTEDELGHCRVLYAAEVTMVDRWIGMLLRKIEDLGLSENTVVIFTSDHGFYLGEHGLMGKSIIKPGASGWASLYEETAHIPLMIQMPDSNRGRCDALVQAHDLMPTILEIAGGSVPKDVHGGSLLPLLRNERVPWREIAVTSPPIINGPVSGERITITNGEWSLIYPGQIEDALRDISQKGTPVLFPGAGFIKAPTTIKHLREALRNKLEPELYHLSSDPRQICNLFEEQKDVAENLHSKMVKFLESIRTREEILRYWREL